MENLDCKVSNLTRNLTSLYMGDSYMYMYQNRVAALVSEFLLQEQHLKNKSSLNGQSL